MFGAVFDHKSETPGLGAEINQYEVFQKQFEGKKIFAEEDFRSIKVVKGGAPLDDYHAVDGISGGTITSDGVSDMLDERLTMYMPYILEKKKAFEVEKVLSQIDSLTIINDSIIQ